MGSHLRDVVGVGAWPGAAPSTCSPASGRCTPARDDLDVVDFGGGFPAYGADPSPADFAAALTDELGRAGLELPADARDRARSRGRRRRRLARRRRCCTPGCAATTGRWSSTPA